MVETFITPHIHPMPKTCPELSITLDPYHLSPREREILEYTVRGVPQREIASFLDCRKSTVEKHIEHLHEKFGTHSILQTVYAASQFGHLNLETYVSEEQIDRVHLLSAREQHILNAILLNGCDHDTDREIGLQTGCGKRTVEKHIRKIKKKLGVAHRFQAALIYFCACQGFET